ncbi:hypothetical protein [Aeromonas enteropelogenes]|uniref:hypothetical protein n=1 Tax=Aeromonas enteropelogenes TaxID=29489 RepID=UPI003BA27029
MKRYSGLSLLLLALSSGPGYAACDNAAAVKLAKAFWSEHRDFYYAEPAKVKALLTPAFFAVLSEEAKCNDEGEVCAIDADPWISAQDGGVTEPITFRLAGQQNGIVSVSMDYRFMLSETRQEPRAVTFQFKTAGDRRCFLLDDFISPGEGSLKQRLQQWQAQNGAGPQ